MARIDDLGQLDYLHDAVVRQITFAGNKAARDLVIRITPDDDCGCPDWCGKNLTLTFRDAVRVSGTLLGHTLGDDSVQSVNAGTSEDMEDALRRFSDIGIPRPPIVLTMSFHSGSALEVACHEVHVSKE